MRLKRLPLLVALIVALLSGISDGIFGETALGEWLSSVGICVAIVVWCHYDAAQRRFDLRTWLRLLILLLSPIGVPIYAFRSRGWSGFRLLGWSLLFLAALAACYGVAAGVTSWITGVQLLD